MKGALTFDAVIGNPPYKDDLWAKFACANLAHVKEGGWMALIHPPNWRGTGKSSSGVTMESREIRERCDIHWIRMTSIEDEAAGKGVFEARKVDGKIKRVGIATDAYVLQKARTEGHLTRIRHTDGSKRTADVRSMRVVQNYPDDLIWRLLAQPGEERIDLRKGQMEFSKVWSPQTPHPCIRGGNTAGDGRLVWTSDGDLLGVPKVVYTQHHSAGRPFVDMDGVVGIADTGRAIVDSPGRLNRIADALESDAWKRAIGSVRVTQNDWNEHVMRLLRRDFWRDSAFAGAESGEFRAESKEI